MKLYEEYKLYETLWEEPAQENTEQSQSNLPFTVEDLAAALEIESVIELGYTREDYFDVFIVDDDQYSCTTWYVEKEEPNSYNLYSYYIGHHGQEKDGDFFKYNNIDELYQAIKTHMPFEEWTDILEYINK